MACTRTLKIGIGALLLLATLLIFDIKTHARERGYSTVAGEQGYKRSGVYTKRYKFRRKAGRSLHDTLFVIDGDGLIIELDDEDLIRRRSFLRNKVSIMRQRSGAKIIRVSEKMKRLGEERAAKREAKMLEDMDKLDIRYYRNNEAYDARFPSIVYLELIKK